MIRSALAVLAGLFAFVAALSAVQSALVAVMTRLYAEMSSPESVIDSGGIASVLWLVWEALSMAGAGYVTAWIASRHEIRHAVIVGAVQSALTLWALFAVREPDSPLWFWVTGILLMVPAAWFGGRLRIQARIEVQ